MESIFLSELLSPWKSWGKHAFYSPLYDYLSFNRLSTLQDVVDQQLLSARPLKYLDLGDQIALGIMACKSLSILSKRDAIRILLNNGFDGFSVDYNSLFYIPPEILQPAAQFSLAFPIDSVKAGLLPSDIPFAGHVKTINDLTSYGLQNYEIKSGNTVSQLVVCNAILWFSLFPQIPVMIVDFLSENGAVFNMNSPLYQENPLFQATTGCFEDGFIRPAIVKELLDLGANPNIVFDEATSEGEGTLIDYLDEELMNAYDWTEDGYVLNKSKYWLEDVKQVRDLFIRYGGKPLKELRGPLWY